MNIHPLLVHFPIALLSVYAVFECLRFKKLLELREWFYIKATFLFLGGLGALAAAKAGDFGKSLFPAEMNIIHVHENFAKLTIIIFGLLALIYLGIFIDNVWGERIRRSSFGSAWEAMIAVDKKVFIGPVLVPGAAIGLLSLIVTGTLGASIVYGVTNDPVTQLVSRIFVRP